MERIYKKLETEITSDNQYKRDTRDEEEDADDDDEEGSGVRKFANQKNKYNHPISKRNL